MRRSLLSLLLLLAAAQGTPAAASTQDQPVHGPVVYEVRERLGKPNRYSGAVTAGDAVYLIKLQLGEGAARRPDYLELSVNGAVVVREDRYPYRFIAGFVRLKKDTTYELSIRDEVPASYRRPPPTPKNVTLTILPVAGNMKHLQGAFGIPAWESLDDLGDRFLQIQDPAVRALAMDAASLHLTTSARMTAMRSLAERREKQAEAFLARMFTDFLAPTDMRAEAAIGLGLLGEKRSIPLLMSGILDPEQQVSFAAARALSFYPEADTQAPLTEVLQRLDPIRQSAAIRTIVSGGWKPIATIMSLAGHDDPKVFATAVGILGGMRDPRATEYLLGLLADPGPHDVRPVISALGDTQDPRATEALLAFGGDAAKRRGAEAELGEALADLGDQRAAVLIADMITKASQLSVKARLQASYRKLTGNYYE
jgi:HEAT repeat protein